LDIDTRRQKQQALITELLERKIRLHARQLYLERGQAEGHALQDWVEAESRVLGSSSLAPLYRKIRAEESASDADPANPQFAATDSSDSEADVS
jgi:Protein of unknown function (DUF2934)